MGVEAPTGVKSSDMLQVASKQPAGHAKWLCRNCRLLVLLKEGIKALLLRRQRACEERNWALREMEVVLFA